MMTTMPGQCEKTSRRGIMATISHSKEAPLPDLHEMCDEFEKLKAERDRLPSGMQAMVAHLDDAKMNAKTRPNLIRQIIREATEKP